MTAMRVALPTAFLNAPIAHRGLHDRAQGRIENALSSVRAAVEAGYGIEIDIQQAACGTPMVFHDYALNRVTAETGPVSARDADALGRIALTDSDDTIPTLSVVLAAVAGRVPLLIEIKEQLQAGPLERAVAEVLEGYSGPVALMSFDPNSVAALAQAAPDIARGLTTEYGPDEASGYKRPEDKQRRREIVDYDLVGASFISHKATDLGDPRVAALKAQGAAVLCWTITSPEAERAARKIAQNITFEGYLPAP